MERPKGTKDIFGKQAAIANSIVEVFSEVAMLYGFNQISTPIFEHLPVFSRAIGEQTEVVSKEMYRFQDKSGRDLVLRPEGTAGVVRAVVENKLYVTLPQRFWYFGPMFRYENPQKGRMRQFHQFGVEAFSAEKSAALDSEVIILAADALTLLGIKYQLQINSLGSLTTRAKYAEALTKYFTNHASNLSPVSQQRITTNPLRILDDKVDRETAAVKGAPVISKYYSSEDEVYFKSICHLLDQVDIKYTINPALVRGLDYYSDITFEFVSVSEAAGAQSTLLGGGRYNDLVSMLGGPALTGIGFAAGIERLVNELEENYDDDEVILRPDLFLLNLNESAPLVPLSLVTSLRRHGFSIDWNYQPLKIQKAFERAERSKAKIYLIYGANEQANKTVGVKIGNLQEQVKISALVKYLDKKLEELESEKE